MLTEGLGILAREKRERIPGEEMLWKYKRGAARAGMGRTEAALADLRAATQPDAPSWVSGRAHNELARLSLAERRSQVGRKPGGAGRIAVHDG